MHPTRDLIFASLEDWDDVWRRNQFVCAELVRRDQQRRILFVALPRNVSHDLRHGRVAALRRTVTYPAPGVERVTVTHPLKLLPDSLVWGRRVNEWLYRRHVRRAARRLGFDRPALWVNPHWAGHVAGRMGESAVVYDVTDDWTAMTQSPAVVERVRRQDADLCGKADAVIVCSGGLAELKRPMNRNVHLVPNGVDADHYAGVLDAGGPVPAAASAWRRPVLGYTGTVHPDRVDVGLVAAVAAAWPGSVVLVGPDHLPAKDAARLDALPNVHRVAAVPYADVPTYMRAFDVCIVPHRVTPFTESLNPIKLWEYLAAGKPIVATPVAGFRDFTELVRLAGTAEEFLAAATEAVSEGGRGSGERQAVAARNSWVARVAAIEGVIRGACEGRRPQSGLTGEGGHG